MKIPGGPGPSGLGYILYLLGWLLLVAVFVGLAVGFVACCALVL